MSGRGGVRSSARLSADPTTGAATAARARPAAPSEAAAQRRARAAERAREVEDSPRVLRDKCRRLARALRNAKHLVVYTGAGISTAADIPDYRGPDGAWTRIRRGQRPVTVDATSATPTYTHMALAALWARGTLKFVVSQNCDGLHVRSGMPRRALAELHGDMYIELCRACRAVYVRAFDTTLRTARHRHGTRRLCHKCGVELTDSIVHFGERGRAAWPLNWAGALRHAARADVVLCLGSSLKVLRRYPRLWRMEASPRDRPALYIVNLQWTPKDNAAALKINARCDAVMAQVARRLRLRVPAYSARTDPLLAHAEPLAPPEAHTAPASLDRTTERSASPSASDDDDDEVPLRRLAERLRPPPPAPPPPAPPPPLRAFHVSLQSGDASILLRAEHAPSPPPAPPAPSAPRPRTHNGCAPTLANGVAVLGSRLRRLLEYEPRIAAGDDDKRPPEVKSEMKVEAKSEVKVEAKSEVGDECALAAAIIRRAMVLCRSSLYPGLHSMIAPRAAPECVWCARMHAARRCLWYGAPRLTPLWRRAWRRATLCACCDVTRDVTPPRTHGAGWYGKGYGKGRRR